MSRRSVAFGIVPSLILVLAACSSGTSESTAPSEEVEESAAAESEPAAESEAPAAELEDTLTVLCTPQEEWCRHGRALRGGVRGRYQLRPPELRRGTRPPAGRRRGSRVQRLVGRPGRRLRRGECRWPDRAIPIGERRGDPRRPEGSRRRVDRRLCRRAGLLLQHRRPRGTG